MNDPVVEAVHYDNAAAGHMDPPAVLYHAVGDGIVVGEIGFAAACRSAVDPDAAGSAVVEIAAGNADLRAAFSDKYAVKAVVDYTALCNRAVLRIFELNRSRAIGGRLRVGRQPNRFRAVNAGGIVVGGCISKFQRAETDVFDMIVGAALESEQGSEAGDAGVESFLVFAVAQDVIKLAVFGIGIEFALIAEHFGDVFKIKAELFVRVNVEG